MLSGDGELEDSVGWQVLVGEDLVSIVDGVAVVVVDLAPVLESGGWIEDGADEVGRGSPKTSAVAGD